MCSCLLIALLRYIPLIFHRDIIFKYLHSFKNKMENHCHNKKILVAMIMRIQSCAVQYSMTMRWPFKWIFFFSFCSKIILIKC